MEKQHCSRFMKRQDYFCVKKYRKRKIIPVPNIYFKCFIPNKASKWEWCLKKIFCKSLKYKTEKLILQYVVKMLFAVLQKILHGGKYENCLKKRQIYI